MSHAVHGIIAMIILAGVILISGCAREEVQVATDQVTKATPVHGQVFMDGKPVTGADVEAVSVDGSQRIINVTDDNGTYALGLQPRVWYKITATSGNLKHTVLPVYIYENGSQNGVYNINLTGTTTIEGSPRSDSKWKGNDTYIFAAPASGDEPVGTVTGDDGNYSLTVKPDVYYTVTAAVYDPGGMKTDARLYYRNSLKCSKVKPGKDETILLDYFAQIPYLGTPPQIVNGTVAATGAKVEQPARMPTSPVPAGGHVYLDNKTVKGARVEAVSLDGTDRVSALTNDTGIYTLMLEPGVMYRATAIYDGLKHSLWPLSQTQNPEDGRNDIRLNASSKSVIAIYFENTAASLLIEAVPDDGSETIIVLTNGSGWYNLDVRPGVKYHIGGRGYDTFGQQGHPRLQYQQDVPDEGIIVSKDETRIAEMGITFFHAPNPFAKPVQATATGRVTIDGKPIEGANVTAIMSGMSDSGISTVTDANGTYTFGLKSQRQYEITATYGGWKRIVWPLYMNDYATGIYDIRLSMTPAPIISGTLSRYENVPILQGNVITAVPVGGGEPVMAVTGASGNYSLEVKPFTYYDISGTSSGADGVNHSLSFEYNNGVSCSGFMLRPYETALIDYRVY